MIMSRESPVRSFAPAIAVFRRGVVLGLLVAALAAASALAAPPVSAWRACPNMNYRVIFLKAYRIRCGDAFSVAKRGFVPGTLTTRTGGLRCTRQPNALHVVWLYTCFRYHHRQGIFFDTRM